MVLLDDVVAILDLSHHDRHVAAGVDRIDGSLIGAAPVRPDLVERPVRCHCLVENAAEIFPDPFYPDVRFIDTPTAADRTFVLASHFFDKQQETSCAPVDRCTLDRYNAPFNRFLGRLVAQQVSRVPADTRITSIEKHVPSKLRCWTIKCLGTTAYLNHRPHPHCAKAINHSIFAEQHHGRPS